MLNPDIRLDEFVLSDLVNEAGRFCATGKSGVFTPIILSSAGNVEDSARKFPTVTKIAKRVLAGLMGIRLVQDYVERKGFSTIVDWVSGCFMLFNSASFAHVGGFDTRYYMYLEDSDICRRLHNDGFNVVLLGSVSVTHDARPASRTDLNHIYWNFCSLIRFLLSDDKVVEL